MQIKAKTVTTLTLVYLYIPICLWFLTWCKGVFALLALAGLLAMFHFKRNETASVKISPITLFVFLVAVTGLALFLGWGGLSLQHYDWFKHGAMLEDLIANPWPVYYETAEGPVMLTYYIGIYIVPALFGKVFGFVFAEWALAVWLILGLVLLLLNLFLIIRPEGLKNQFLTVLGCLGCNYPFILQLVYWMIFRDDVSLSSFGFYIEDGSGASLHGVLRGLFTGMKAFPAIVPVFLTAVIFYRLRQETGLYVFIWAPLLLYSTMSLIGAFCVALPCFIHYSVSDDRKPLKHTLLYNAIAFMALAVPMLLYLSGNILQEKPVSVGFGLQAIWVSPGRFILFILTDVVLYAVLTYKENGKSLIYYVAFGSIFVLAFFRFGLWNDLFLCGTLPLTAFVMIMLCKSLTGKDKRIRCALVVLLTFVSVAWLSYPSAGGESVRNAEGETTYTIDRNAHMYGYDLYVKDGFYTYGSMSRFLNEDREVCFDDLKYNYFTYDCNEKVFCKYIARKGKERRDK